MGTLHVRADGRTIENAPEAGQGALARGRWPGGAGLGAKTSGCGANIQFAQNPRKTTQGLPPVANMQIWELQSSWSFLLLWQFWRFLQFGSSPERL